MRIFTTVLTASLLAIALWSSSSLAKKKETSAIIFGVKPFIGCDVCEGLAEAAVVHRDEVKRNVTSSGRKLTEDRILDDVLEPICNPHTEVGDWLRRVDWTIASRGDAKTVAFQVRDEFGKCKSKCWTAAEVCERIMSSESADELSAMLLKESPTKLITKSLCSASCEKQRQVTKQSAKSIKNEWGAELFEPIESKEKEIEEMMERMAMGPNGGQSADVFTRDEMDEIQTAMSRGDLEKLQELDPTYSELDEDSFAALREMSGESGNAKSRENEDLASEGEQPRVPQAPKPEPSSVMDRLKSWIGW